ncbi:MAG: 30S ribosomal protein S12 methylthiotransferase RimO [Anaerovoracaceae bacterium]|jgi:ribosomal protein S12 methylthiotransferase
MKIYIETLGCPKNFNDSQVVGGILEEAGHQVIDEVRDADAIMVNTCGFINDAKKESIQCIFDMAAYDKMLIVSGCLSQRYGDELFEEMPEVDIFLGVNDYEQLPEILAGHEKGRREKYLNLYEKEMDTGARRLDANPYSSTIKISEGCDNHCTYCVIPSIRGPYRSRPKEEILAEAEALAVAGTKEIILIAQDSTAYGIDLYGGYVLHELVSELCKVEGISWIRLMYCYEERLTDELIEVMAREEKVCNYLDMPLQHASDKILKAMNRRSSREKIQESIGKLRRAMPDIHIRTTLITGFPGEGEEEFEELLDFVEEVRFERLGVFTYSPEEGTPAAEMEEQVEEKTKDERKDAIMRRQMEISLEKNREKIGRTLEILVEGREEDGSYYGRSRYDAPEIDNQVLFISRRDLQLGDLVLVKIEDAFDYDLTGVEI